MELASLFSIFYYEFPQIFRIQDSRCSVTRKTYKPKNFREIFCKSSGSLKNNWWKRHFQSNVPYVQYASFLKPELFYKYFSKDLTIFAEQLFCFSEKLFLKTFSNSCFSKTVWRKKDIFAHNFHIFMESAGKFFYYCEVMSISKWML